jgi:hypothetical protein
MSGKGFGKKATPVVDKSVEAAPVKDSSSISTSLETTPTAIESARAKLDEKISLDQAVSKSKAALKTKMYEARKEDIARKMKELEEEEALIASDPSVGAVPEIVANRMITRMAGFFGIPVFGGESACYQHRQISI